MRWLEKFLGQRPVSARAASRGRRRLRGEPLEARRLLTTAHGDFNGDGVDDLAFGVPGEDLGSIVDAGAVNVIYGQNTWSGLSSPGNQIWHQNSFGVPGVAEARDRFGHSLAVGDFNGDGYDDLAIGIPGEDIGSIADAGAVNVLYGSSSGLTSVGSQFWHQNRPGINDVAETNDSFGSSLTTGDFNNDGRDDLAVGVPHENLGATFNAGAVNIIYGRSAITGLTSSGDQFWHQNTPGIDGFAENNDMFGVSLASGDFNGDGRDDLAVGVPNEDIGAIFNAGAVNVIYGRYAWTGLGSVGDQIWSQDTGGVAGAPEAGDNFGYSVATGDFNGDGRDDLAIGVSGEDIGAIADAGCVNVLYGRSATVGLTTAGNQLWHQNSPGIDGFAEAGDYFGASLTTGDFNGDGRDDLAVGVHREDIGAKTNAGAVNVIYGRYAWSGLSSVGDQVWHQDSWSVLDVAEPWDNFGRSLTAGDFNGDGRDDLAIGVLNESIGSATHAGAVEVIYGRVATTGLSALGDQFWHQNSPGIQGVAETSDRIDPLII